MGRMCHFAADEAPLVYKSDFGAQDGFDKPSGRGLDFMARPSMAAFAELCPCNGLAYVY